MTKIKLFEAFAGVGSQHMALKNIGVEVEPVGISEWDINALLSYDAIHSENRDVDLTEDMTVEDLEKFLVSAGISANGKDPMTEASIKKMTEARKREIVNAMKRTNNIGSIVGKTAPECDLFTYSFPCQDISVAGKQGGFSEGSDTRSSLLWQCRNTIEAVKPKALLMENVKNLVSKKHKADFDIWCEWLEGQGYTNYWKVLNAKDFGSAQSRDRVFMVSILNEGEDKFEFPTEQKETPVIKDILEDEVHSDYYVKEELTGELVLKDTLKKDDERKVNRVGGLFDKEGKRHQAGAVFDINGHAPTLDTMQGGYRQPCIITHKYTEKVKVRVHEIDKIALATMLRKARTKSKKTIKDLAVELDTPLTEVEHWFRLDEHFSVPSPEIWFDLKNALSIEDTTYDKAVTEFVIKDGSFDQANRVYDENGISPTLTATMTSKKVLVEDKETSKQRIRKLTPKECWRLMGFSDEDFRKASIIMSNNQLYKQAGNSIVVPVLEGIFKSLYKKGENVIERD